MVSGFLPFLGSLLATLLQPFTVVLDYVPTSRVLLQPAVGYLSPELQRIGMFICGPRITGGGWKVTEDVVRLDL